MLCRENMMRIYLHLIEERPSSDTTDEQALRAVKAAVENVVKIQWEMEPQRHAKGGLGITGNIPDDTDFEAMAKQLKSDGYAAVI